MPWLQKAVLAHATLAGALTAILAETLAGADFEVGALRALHLESLGLSPELTELAALDLEAIVARDPACNDLLGPFLFFKGFHALQWHRAAHVLWRADLRLEACLIQSRVSARLAIDIHPAARIGRRLFIDHGTGVVIGETAIIGDDVSILHNVTLGGTGKEQGDRHPKIRDGALLAAGAKILGNIEVGRGAKVAAGSVVVREVLPWTTVAGVPARVVEKNRGEVPALTMDQSFSESQYYI